MDYSLVENLKWLRDNKTAFLEALNKILPEDSGLTVEDSWDTIDEFIKNLETDYIDLDGATAEQMERFLNDTMETAISVSSDTINSYSFYKKSSLCKIKADNATSIKDYAFESCTGLTEANLSSVTSIGSYAFEKCTNLKTIYAPNISTIGTAAFAECTSLPNLDWLDFSKITSLGQSAFSTCTNISGDILLNCKTTVPNYTFSCCNNIDRIIITEDVSAIKAYILYTGIGSTTRPEGYNLKYIACEQSEQPSSWSTYWNYSYNTGYYIWPTLWNATIKEWVFVGNNGKDDQYWTGRVLEEFPEVTYEGYEFDGWYWDKDFTDPVTLPCTSEDTIPVLYAKWIKGYNLVAVNIEDGNKQTELGIKYSASFANILTDDTTLHYIGFYKEDSLVTTVNENTYTSSEILPTVYVKAINSTMKNYEYTGSTETISLDANTYTVECWGAQGGDGGNASPEHIGGYGGYSIGKLTIGTPITAYINVGGAGTHQMQTGLANGGFNGGGTSHVNTNNSSYWCGSGGGGTDLRLVSNSLYARVIVAGGGGGASGLGYNSSSYTGAQYGWAGGENACGQTEYTITGGTATGASQTAGGVVTYTNGGAGAAGSFGQGGGYTTAGSAYAHAGAGGGWYGGAGGCWGGYAGGGSGYVYTEDTAANYPTECLLNSDYYLEDAKTVSGSTTFTDYYGVESLGHQGNGYLRIIADVADEYACTVTLYANVSGVNKLVKTFTANKNLYVEDVANYFEGYSITDTTIWYSDNTCSTEKQYPIELPLGGTISAYIKAKTESARLPKEYQEVEYITGASNAIIDTGYTCNLNTIIESKIMSTSSVSDESPFSDYWWYNQYLLEIKGSGSDLNLRWHACGNSSVLTPTVSDYINKEITIIAKNGYIEVNGTAYSGTAMTSLPYVKTLRLFGSAYNYVGYYYLGRMYYCNIKESETMLHEYVPCYRKADSVVGFYDLTTDTFLTSSGTGSFTAGPDVVYPEEFVQSDGLAITDGVVTGIGTCTDSVVYINMPVADKAFYNTTQVTEVHIGPECTNIGYECCYATSGQILTIYFYGTTTTIGDDAFGCTWDNANFKVYVPTGSYDYYAYTASTFSYWKSNVVDAGKLLEWDPE